MEKEAQYQSKGVWGSGIVILLGFLQTFNITSIGPITIDNMTANQEGIAESLVQVGTFIAGAVALWGRLTATKKVALKKDKK